MEENKVIINAISLKNEIKNLVDDFKFDIGMLLDNVEEYIKVEQVLKEDEEGSPKFKVGDVLTGKEGSEYAYTTNESVLLVTDVIGNEIKVKIIDHKLFSDEIGQEYLVESNHFKLIKDIL